MIQFTDPRHAHFHLQLLWALAAMFVIVVIGLGVAIWETDMMQTCLKMLRNSEKQRQATSSGEGSPLIKERITEKILRFKTATVTSSKV